MHSAWRQPARYVRLAYLTVARKQRWYESSACFAVRYVAKYPFYTIPLGIPLTRSDSLRSIEAYLSPTDLQIDLRREVHFPMLKASSIVRINEEG